MAMVFPRIVVQNIKPWTGFEGYPLHWDVRRPFSVSAEVLSADREVVRADLLYRASGSESWLRVPMEEATEARYQGKVHFEKAGLFEFTVEAWTDRFSTWLRKFTSRRREDEGRTLLQLRELETLAEEAAQAAREQDREQLEEFAAFLRSEEPLRLKTALALDEDLAELLKRLLRPLNKVPAEPAAKVLVAPHAVGGSSWFELFEEPEAGESVFETWDKQAERARRLGFDVVSLPVLQPVGGPAGQRDPEANETPAGVPRAVGTADADHRSLRAELGTREELEAFLAGIADKGLQAALQLPLACSPGHPYLKSHPEWFQRHIDGAIAAEGNTAVPGGTALRFDFDGPYAAELGRELVDVVGFWSNLGIRIFRILSPVSAPPGFWDGLLDDLRRRCPEVAFSAEWEVAAPLLRRLGAAGFHWKPVDLPDAWETELWMRLAMEKAPDAVREVAVTEADGGPFFAAKVALAAVLFSTFCVPGKTVRDGTDEAGVDPWSWLRPLLDARARYPAFWEGSEIRPLGTDSRALVGFLRLPAPGLTPTDPIVGVVGLDPYGIRRGCLEVPWGELEQMIGRPCQAEDLFEGSLDLCFDDAVEVAVNPQVRPLALYRLGPCR